MSSGSDILAAVLRGATLVSFAGLCLVVAVVGAVAVLAELQNTWRWYFRMEQTIALATPIVLGLLGLALASTLGLVVFTTTNRS